MKCVDCKFHKAFPTTNIHWCEATKKHRRISDEDAYVDAPCRVADRKTEPTCDDCIWNVCNYNKVPWGEGDEPQTNDSRFLSYWKDRAEKKYLNEDEPQTDVYEYHNGKWTKPQTERSE